MLDEFESVYYVGKVLTKDHEKANTDYMLRVLKDSHY